MTVDPRRAVQILKREWQEVDARNIEINHAQRLGALALEAMEARFELDRAPIDFSLNLAAHEKAAAAYRAYLAAAHQEGKHGT